MFFASCKGWKSNEKEEILTPWGDIIAVGDTLRSDTSDVLSLRELVANGEIIMLTENGPQTYYEYKGSALGTQYLLVEAFAQRLGVRVRVEICRDSLDILSRLENNEGDIAAFLTPGDFKASTQELSDSISRWYTARLLNDVLTREKDIVASGGVKRKVYSPYRNPEGGVISSYDIFFKRYGQQTGWDWRLIAAQCYQESTFDPNAVSFAGAKGLMQIMPSTAAHLGLAAADIYDPEKSIAAACRYIVELSGLFSDVPDAFERQNFVLASYNGGAAHIRDAMALAMADGRNEYYWENVKPYILKLATPAGYRNPIVKHGYMRGWETAGYVDAIRRRFQTYGGSNNVNGRTYIQQNKEYQNIREFSPTAPPQRAAGK
ncbi:MAG: transglycosylase SLT domain-containing protein [Bacteroidaceae bacterium]|nr:transglycosylase SLT domain-containing protein [Bacteroidaceae bacterium]